MDEENLIRHGPIKMLYPGLSLSNKDTENFTTSLSE